MRYLILFLLTFAISCGDDSAKPVRKNDLDLDTLEDMSLEMTDMGGTDYEEEGGVEEVQNGCSPLECIDEKLINMIDIEKNYELAYLGGVEIKPEPFEFGFDMGE